MLTFKPFEASSVFQFPDPDTGRMHTAHTRAELVATIVNYRIQNRLAPIVRLDLVLNNYLCTLPINAGKCAPQPLKRGFMQYIKGGLALIEQLYYGDANMVSQAEADRRAQICINCSCNVFPDRDMFIKWSDDLALHTIGDRKSAVHDKLGNCDGCSCPLRCKVWYKGPFNLSPEEKDKMKTCNPSCWQLHLKD